MDLPNWVLWVLAGLNLIWAIFAIVVMIKVLWLTSEAEPFFRRENERARSEAFERDRAKGVRTGSRY